MPHFITRLLPAVSGAATLLLAAGAVAGPAAASERAEGAFTFDRLTYAQEMRAGGIESYAEIPRQAVQNFGYSYVALEKTAESEPICTVESAGAYAGEEVEQGVLKGGAAPIEEGQSASDATGYENPTLTRQVKPDSGASETSATDVAPSIPAEGNGLVSKAECADDALSGTSRGDIVNALGFRFAGSNVESKVDEATGAYTTTGRAYVTGIDGAYDSMSSMMQVTDQPGSGGGNSEPTVNFRLTFFNSDAGMSGFTSDGFTLGGTDIPASEFVDTFNQQAEAFAKMGAAVGPAGVKFLSPEVYTDQDSGFLKITAPSATGNLGFASQENNVGQNFGLRFGAITWTGDQFLVE